MPLRTDLSVSPIEPLRLTVSARSQIQKLDPCWQFPSCNGGSLITGYKAQWKQMQPKGRPRLSYRVTPPRAGPQPNR